MTDQNENPLDDIDLDAALAKEEWLEQKLARYEANVVRKIFKLCVAPWIDKAVDSLAKFREYFPTFPMWLGVRPTGKMDRVPISALFKYERLIKTKLYAAWEECLELAGEQESDWYLSRPVGLVFEYPGLGTLVLHSMPTRSDKPGTSLVLIPGQMEEEGMTAPVLVIEPLTTVINRLGWVPEPCK